MTEGCFFRREMNELNSLYLDSATEQYHLEKLLLMYPDVVEKARELRKLCDEYALPEGLVVCNIALNSKARVEIERKRITKHLLGF